MANTAAMFNLHAPPGFRGFDENAPFRFYRRHLPHWRQEGASYFVTFRLSDSLPQQCLHELKAIREQILAKSGRLHTSDPLLRQLMTRIEEWLDQGVGSCVLDASDARSTVQDCISSMANVMSFAAT